MSQREQEIFETLVKAYPKMTDFEKGYFLGVAESKAGEKEEKDCREEEG